MYEFEIFARPGEEKRLESFIAKTYPSYTKYVNFSGESEETVFVAKGNGMFILECLKNGASEVSRGLNFTSKMKRV